MLHNVEFNCVIVSEKSMDNGQATLLNVQVPELYLLHRSWFMVVVLVLVRTKVYLGEGRRKIVGTSPNIIGISAYCKSTVGRFDFMGRTVHQR
jgi:hypothetical protein